MSVQNIALVRKKFSLESNIKLDIDINILNARVYTVNTNSILHIDMEIELESFESLIDCAVKERTNFLIILDILTFFTDVVFMPIDCNSTETKIGKKDNVNVERFSVAGINRIRYIQIFKKFISTRKYGEVRLVYSLIDRWRKGYYLSLEGEESLIHEDEILLSYFHILELLSEDYYNEQKSDADQKIDDFTKDILNNVFLINSSQFESEYNLKKKLIREIMISHFPIKSKIFFMLKKQGLLDDKLSSFISELINDRNSVAHGRQVYQDRLVYPPIPQFFPLIKARMYSNEILKYLSGRVIAIYLNIDYLEDEWNNAHKFLLPTKEKLEVYTKEKRFNLLSNQDFCNGIIDNITPETITNCLYQGRINLKLASKILEPFILKFNYSKNETILLFEFAAIKIDEADGTLKEKCLDIIRYAHEKDLGGSPYMRDTLYQLESLGFKPKIFREMIENKELK